MSPPLTPLEAVAALRAVVALEGGPEAPCPACKALHPTAGSCECECHGRRIEWFEQARADALARTAHLVTP